MSDTSKIGTFAMTVPTLQSFPNLFEAKAVQRNGKATGEPKFSNNLEFLPDHVDFPALKAAAVAVARAKWPGRDLKELSFPFVDGGRLADKAKAKGKEREWSRGRIVLTARSKYQPRLAVVDGGKMIDVEGANIPTHKGKFYNGVSVLAQVTFSAYDAVQEDGKDGINAYLDVVVSINKGKKLSGGGSAAEVFKGYIGTASDEDPTSGADLDDEIPF